MSTASLVDRFQGCLLALAVGDALGAPLEFMSRAEIKARYGRVVDMMSGGWLGLEAGEYTDDTEMMLCIARSLVEKGRWDPQDAAQRFGRWFEGGPKDVGRITAQALEALKAGARWDEAGEIAHRLLGGKSAGNGSIMRCAPIGLLYCCDTDRLISSSVESSRITHWAPQARWGAAALNLAIAQLVCGRREGLIEEVAKRVEEPVIGEALRKTASLTYDQVPNSGYVVHTLQAAWWCFEKTTSLEEAVITAVNLGGDADTIGAVCGALAGAYYGKDAIPHRWLASLRGREEIESLALAIYHLVKG